MKTFFSFLQEEVFKQSVLITSHLSLKLFKSNLDKRSVNASSLNAMLPEVTTVLSLNKLKNWKNLDQSVWIYNNNKKERAKILTQAEIKSLKKI